MTPLVWMIGVGLTGWLAATVLSPVPINPAALAGLAAPLACVCLTWMVVVWTYGAAPGRLTHVMMAGLAAKMLVFPAYVVVALRAWGLDGPVFVISFVTSFLVLYAIEALCLARLFAGRLSAGRA
jgi:hypothetical protein